ncbi:ribbon-helix-helix protein, CopG family [Sphingobium phenoxybenzoativorans]|uniref:ribbon-helix-helix protein, CopG family n=1 Tax=Sphingobium phenoxybenzoativorans TaxID=1592790 RepID=UPI000872680B|nr:ribbon-helix-helix protein, CopG family [Sphingobium phenoxybenzoativorans]
MKSFKTRHQLFLPEDMSKRLAHLAKSSGRARSEILVEALDAWLTRRGAPKTDEAIGIRLVRIERNVEWLRRNQGLSWEVMARLVKHQLIRGVAMPPAKEDVAAGSKLFADFIDEIADRFAGQDVPPTSDPTMQKLRSLQ